MEDPYTVLGVTRSATTNEIKSKFRGLLLSLHPDKVNIVTNNNENQPIEYISESAETIEKLVAARDVLLNSESRKKLDLSLDMKNLNQTNANIIPISDFKFLENSFTFPCRCGDIYSVRKY